MQIEQTRYDALAAELATLPVKPAKPVMGKGNVRECFGAVRRGDLWRVWSAIPSAHKAHLRYSTGSSLAYRGTRSNIVVSPEAKEILKKYGL